MATIDLSGALERTARRARRLQGSPDDIHSAAHPWRQALLLGSVFASIKLLIHIAVNIQAQHVGYGLFRDELYYIVCGRRLAWGYLDNQPLIPILTRLTDLLFGHDRLWTFRLLPSIAGATKVLLTGLLAFSLGGNRKAQALAMIAVIGAPEYLGVDSILSMNCLEPVFWMTAMLALLEIAKQPPIRIRAAWWLTFGFAGGLALETKLSGAFFLICLLAALLVTPGRRLLLDRWSAAGVALLLLIELPNLIWQARRDFPTIQWLVDASHEGKDVILGPVAFLWQQVLVLIPFSAVIWMAGAAWLLFSRRARSYRFSGLSAILFIALMIVLHAKIYYVVPIYPILFASGAVFWTDLMPRKPVWQAAPIIYMTTFALAAWYWMPVVLPIVPPAHFINWQHRLHFRPKETENFRETALPQLLADMTSWPEIVTQIAAAYHSLPENLRSDTTGPVGIYCSNYGEASAVDVYGAMHDLPPAISGHQHYWFWGPRNELRDSLLVIGQRREDVEKSYRDVRPIATIHASYAMPFEDGATIWFAQHRIRPPQAIWSSAKAWY